MTLGCWLVIVAAMADDTPWHWAHVPLPYEVRIHRLVAWPIGGVAVVTSTHGVLQRTPTGWTQVVPPLLDQSAYGAQFHVFGDQPHLMAESPVRVRRFEDGRWQAWRYVPGLIETRTGRLDAQGRWFFVDQAGRVIVEREGRFVPAGRIEGLAIHKSEPDRQGGAWSLQRTQADAGVITHWTAGGDLHQHSLPAPGTRGVAIGPRGEQLALTDEGVFEWRDGWTHRAGRGRAKWFTQNSSSWAVASTSEVWWASGRGVLSQPLPGPDCIPTLGSDDVLYLSCQDARLYALTRGERWSFRDVRDPLVDGAPVSTYPIDVDRDGLDDLLAVEATHAYVLHQTTDLGFERMPGPNVRNALALAVCDIDGDGRQDIVVSQSQPPRVEVHLNHGTWWEPLDPLHPFEGVASLGAYARVRCQDLNGDDAPDLLLTAANAGAGAPRSVAMYSNDGVGRLTQVTLAHQGLGGVAYVYDVVPGDLDGDGYTDLLIPGLWGRPPRMYQGRPDGTFTDRSAGVGLATHFAETYRGWFVQLDQGGPQDLLLADRNGGLRAYLAREPFRFEEATERVGLAHLAERPSSALVVDDLDGDGWADWVSCDQGRSCTLMAGGPSGFEDHSAVLAAAGADAIRVLDLGADGDLDVLLLSSTGNRLVERRGAGQRLPPTPARRAHPVVRRMLRASPLTYGLGLGILAAWVPAWWWGRRRDWSVVGRPVGTLAVAAVLAGGWLFLAEAQPVNRASVAVGLMALGPLVLLVEAWWADLRTAEWVGPYRLLDELGEGGMGRVHRARHRTTGAIVALKRMHTRLYQGEEGRRQFSREAKLGCALEHPRLVKLEEWGEQHDARDPDLTTAWIAMEYLQGATLRRRLIEQGRFGIGPACRVVRQVAQGLAAMHRCGIVHRDIKPQNVMMLNDGQIKVMDFGAARFTGQATQAYRPVIGTPGYLAPEQARGGVPDPASDMFACGVLLFELLTGRPPYPASDFDAYRAVLERPPPALQALRPDVPDELAALVQRMMALDPPRRVADMSTLDQALAAFATVAPAPDDASPGQPMPAHPGLNQDTVTVEKPS